MSINNMSPQELHESNDKFAFYGLIAWLGGFLVGSIIFLFILIWCFKWVANNVFKFHFRPIHGKSHSHAAWRVKWDQAYEVVVLLEILRNNTPLALYRRARTHIKEKRERRRQQDDIEKARSSRSPECSLFTLAYSSENDRDKYYSSHQPAPASSFSRNHTVIEKPKPVLAQHNEAWWKEQGSEDLATVIRHMQEAAYSKRASNQ